MPNSKEEYAVMEAMFEAEKINYSKNELVNALYEIKQSIDNISSSGLSKVIQKAMAFDRLSEYLKNIVLDVQAVSVNMVGDNLRPEVSIVYGGFADKVDFSAKGEPIFSDFTSSAIELGLISQEDVESINKAIENVISSIK